MTWVCNDCGRPSLFERCIHCTIAANLLEQEEEEEEE